MNIAFIVSSRKKAGPIIVVADYIKLLQKNNHSCKFFYFDECDVGVSISCESEKITMDTVFDFSQYDIVHCHGGRPNLYVTLHKPLFCKTKFLTTIHSYIFQDFRYSYGIFKGFIAALIALLFTLRFDKIIALSNDAKKYYKRFLFFKKIDFLYNTVNSSNKKLSEEQECELLNFKEDKYLLGINGILNKRKGQYIAISCLPYLPQCKLFLLGSGVDEMKLRTLAENLGVSDRVYFAGYRKNAVDYLPYYDVFLFPSHSEGCPLALLEAVALNKKIACSNIAVHREMLADTEVVFFDIANISDVVRGISEILSASNEQPKLQACYQNKFSHEKIYSELLRIYGDF